MARGKAGPNWPVGVGARRPRPIIPLVVKGEIKSLALQFQWGDQRNEQLDALLRELPVADISSEAVIQAYARIDHESRRIGRRMGKNDLWIAAVAAVQSAAVLTTDQDFDHLPASFPSQLSTSADRCLDPDVPSRTTQITQHKKASRLLGK